MSLAAAALAQAMGVRTQALDGTAALRSETWRRACEACCGGEAKALGTSLATRRAPVPPPCPRPRAAGLDARHPVLRVPQRRHPGALRNGKESNANNTQRYDLARAGPRAPMPAGHAPSGPARRRAPPPPAGAVRGVPWRVQPLGGAGHPRARAAAGRGGRRRHRRRGVCAAAAARRLLHQGRRRRLAGKRPGTTQLPWE